MIYPSTRAYLESRLLLPQQEGEELFRLKQFNEIACRINDPNLRAARSAINVITTEFHSSGAKPNADTADRPTAGPN